MKNIAKQLKPFKIPLIILGVFLVVALAVRLVMPLIQNLRVGDATVVQIEAENSRKYVNGDTLSKDDFKVSVVFDNGVKQSIGSDEFELTNYAFNPIGEQTTIELYYLANPAIKTSCPVSVERTRLIGFQCGYPNRADVTAVWYSNGELAFEGKGDVLIYNDGQFPWQVYHDEKMPPITAVSFQPEVQPTNMNYWFHGLSTLVYTDAIPSSVKTMVATYSGCTSLTHAADLSKCKALLNMNRCYDGCVALTDAGFIPSTVRYTGYAFQNCTELQTSPAMDKAEALTSALNMFAGCKKLINTSVAPNLVSMEGMYSDCINLKEMPEIPETVRNLNSAFSGCLSLETGSRIHGNVRYLNNTFANCEMLNGDLEIAAVTQECSNIFSGAVIATRLNLIGTSYYLDLYANTATSGNVYVNGYTANDAIRNPADANEMDLRASEEETEEPTTTEPETEEPTTEAPSSEEPSSETASESAESESSVDGGSEAVEEPATEVQTAPAAETDAPAEG